MYCDGTTSVDNCTHFSFPADFPDKCRDGCGSTMAMSACVSEANAGASPDISPNRQTEPNNATAQCYRSKVCLKFGEYVSCWQCLINNNGVLKGNALVKENIVQSLNSALLNVPPYCQSIGVNASSYAPLVMRSGASTSTTTVSGALLLVHSIAAAFLL